MSEEVLTCYENEGCEEAAIILLPDNEGGFACPECAASYVLDDDGYLVLD